MRNLLTLLAGAALAAPQVCAAGTLWLCGLSEDAVRLVCVADDDPVEAVAAAAQENTAVVKGTRFPLDPRGVWTVDLWTPSTDTAQLDLLARATICYRSPGCEVRLTAARPAAGMAARWRGSPGP